MMSKLALSIGKQARTYKPLMDAKKEKDKAWDAFALYIRLRDAVKTTQTLDHCRCITCDHVYEVSKTIHAGHFMPGRGGAVLFDFMQVNGQCFRCNYYLKGNWPAYEKKMIILYGEDKVQDMKRQKDNTLKWSAWEYREKADQCRALLAKLIKPFDLSVVDERIIKKLKSEHVLILEKTTEKTTSAKQGLRINPEFDET